MKALDEIKELRDRLHNDYKNACAMYLDEELKGMSFSFDVLRDDEYLRVDELDAIHKDEQYHLQWMDREFYFKMKHHGLVKEMARRAKEMTWNPGLIYVLESEEFSDIELREKVIRENVSTHPKIYERSNPPLYDDAVKIRDKLKDLYGWMEDLFVKLEGDFKFDEPRFEFLVRRNQYSFHLDEIDRIFESDTYYVRWGLIEMEFSHGEIIPKSTESKIEDLLMRNKAPLEESRYFFEGDSFDSNPDGIIRDITRSHLILDDEGQVELKNRWMDLSGFLLAAGIMSRVDKERIEREKEKMEEMKKWEEEDFEYWEKYVKW